MLVVLTWQLADMRAAVNASVAQMVSETRAVRTLIEERTSDPYTGREAMADGKLRDAQLAAFSLEIRRLQIAIDSKPPRWLIERLEVLERKIDLYLRDVRDERRSSYPVLKGGDEARGGGTGGD
jgi:hypothetical protein